MSNSSAEVLYLENLHNICRVSNVVTSHKVHIILPCEELRLISFSEPLAWLLKMIKGLTWDYIYFNLQLF